jgi:hypothetical protein
MKKFGRKRNKGLTRKNKFYVHRRNWLINPFRIISKGHGKIVDTTAIITAHNFTSRMSKLFAGICVKPVVKIKTATSLLAEYQ